MELSSECLELNSDLRRWVKTGISVIVFGEGLA